MRGQVVARWVAGLCGVLLASGALAGAIIYPGTNVGAIPDGAGAGPRNYGAARDVRFEVSGFVRQRTFCVAASQATSDEHLPRASFE